MTPNPSLKNKLLPLIAHTLLLVIAAYGVYRGVANDNPRDFFITFAALAAMFFVAWREKKNSSGAARGEQNSIDSLQQRLNKQDDFFRLVNENTPSTLVIYDGNDDYWFVNASAAREMGVAEKDTIGKKPVEILGAARGRKVMKDLEQVRKTAKPLESADQFTDATTGVMRYVQTYYCPLAAFGDFPGGIMARGEDVTRLVIEREKQEDMLRQVIATLVAVVDRRDPYASGHSARTGQLARALATELSLSDRDIEAAQIAGSLMNFGKVLISRAVLTKTEALTQEELQRIRDSILTSADILSRIDFNAPVVATLRQVLERYDGSGTPEGLKGEQILISARIVAVANAFVAMVSPRAYRAGIDLSVAAEKLGHDAGAAFDPRVISALQNYIVRNKAKLDWLAMTKTI